MREWLCPLVEGGGGCVPGMRSALTVHASAQLCVAPHAQVWCVGCVRGCVCVCKPPVCVCRVRACGLCVWHRTRWVPLPGPLLSHALHFKPTEGVVALLSHLHAVIVKHVPCALAVGPKQWRHVVEKMLAGEVSGGASPKVHTPSWLARLPWLSPPLGCVCACAHTCVLPQGANNLTCPLLPRELPPPPPPPPFPYTLF
jgi:hypothetical protein